MSSKARLLANAARNIRSNVSYVADGSTTTFNAPTVYNVGYVDVFFNGVKLTSGVDYTATDGATVAFSVAPLLNTRIDITTYGVSLQDASQIGTTLTANGGVGTAGQVLTSGGSSNAYWSTVSSGGGGGFTNGQSISVGDLSVGSNVVWLNDDMTPSDAPTENVGFAVNRGTEATVSMMWIENEAKWMLEGGGVTATGTVGTFDLAGESNEFGYMYADATSAGSGNGFFDPRPGTEIGAQNIGTDTFSNLTFMSSDAAFMQVNAEGVPSIALSLNADAQVAVGTNTFSSGAALTVNGNQTINGDSLTIQAYQDSSNALVVTTANVNFSSGLLAKTVYGFGEYGAFFGINNSESNMYGVRGGTAGIGTDGSDITFSPANLERVCLCANGQINFNGPVLPLYDATIDLGSASNRWGNTYISKLFISGTITANGTTGTAGQVLTSNGTSTYWSTVSSGGGGGTVAGGFEQSFLLMGA